jgi:ectoine hydroxylase
VIESEWEFEMQLKSEQIAAYERDGMLVCPGCFSPTETTTLNAEVHALMERDSPGRLFEADGKTVRALHGCHKTSEFFSRLIRHPRLLEPARQMLGSDVYLHQFKINIKAAFGGDVWQWHQDYIFWNQQDGIESPRLVNVAIFANEVTEFNGPLYFITGSHRHGMVESAPADEARADQPAWAASFSAKLKYTLDRSDILKMLEEGELVSPKGPAGSVLFFHPNLAHGSVPNISPQDRTLIILTYNSVQNLPRPVAEPRPEFLVSRDYTVLEPVADEDLQSSVAIGSGVDGGTR